MSGWWISVKNQSDHDETAQLASWDADDAQWLELLADENLASQVKTGGYPNSYTLNAKHVLPVLASGIPPASREDTIRLYADNIAACAPSQQLLIEVWDLS